MSRISDPVPLSLFHTGRAACPECGAPLPLTEGRPMADRLRAAHEFTEGWPYFNVAAVRLLPQ